MAIPDRITRNRANAQRSTGPKTDEGRAIVAQNATTHGLLAQTPVISGVEDPAAWAAHRTGILASLGAEGALEMALAERVALALWRLARAVRAEQAAIVLERQEQQKDILGHTAEGKAAERLQRSQAILAELKRLPGLADREPLPYGEAIALLDAAASTAGVDDYDELTFPFLPAGDPVSDHDGWTAKELRQAFTVVAKARNLSVEVLSAATLRAVQQELTAARKAVREEAERRELERQTHLVPSSPTLDRLTRYETHLTREWTRSLHELERLQAARTGQPVSSPIAIDVTVDDAETADSGFVS